MSLVAAVIDWTVDPVIVELFGFELRYYGILFVIGLISSMWFLSKLFEFEEISKEHLDALALYAFLGIVAGARLGHCLFYDPSYYLSHPLEMLLPVQWNSDGVQFTGYLGLASHGGVIGLIIAIYLYAKNKGIEFLQILDLVAVVAPLAGCFIRLGNLMNHEIIGKPSDLPWSFAFEEVDSIPRHPAQLYEAICYLIIFIVLWNMFRRGFFQRPHGRYLGTCLIMVFTARFAIEFLKERQVSFEDSMFLDMGQLLSIPFVVLGCFLLFRSTQRESGNL